MALSTSIYTIDSSLRYITGLLSRDMTDISDITGLAEDVLQNVAYTGDRDNYISVTGYVFDRTPSEVAEGTKLGEVELQWSITGNVLDSNADSNYNWNDGLKETINAYHRIPFNEIHHHKGRFFRIVYKNIAVGASGNRIRIQAQHKTTQPFKNMTLSGSIVKIHTYDASAGSSLTTLANTVTAGRMSISGGVDLRVSGLPVLSTNPVSTAGYGRDKETLTNNIIAPFGDQRITQLTRVTGGSFDGNTIDPFVWTTTVSGGGTVPLQSGAIMLTTTTASGSSCILESAVPARFQSAFSNQLLCGIILSDPTATNNTRRWGVFDGSNGFFYELQNGTFKIGVRKDAVTTYITSFNGNFGASGPTLNTNSVGFEIWYHGGRQFFLSRSILIHSITPGTSTTVSTLNLKSRFECVNTGITSAPVTLSVVASAINRCSGIQSRPSYFNIATAGTTVLKRGPGTLHSVVINDIGAASSTVTVYDNTAGSGTKIATLNTAKTILTDINYNLDFYNGLTIVTVGTFGDITVTWD